jgi:hypothetical protein
MKAMGEWVVLQHEDITSSSGIISNEGDTARVLSVGFDCPDEVKELEGKYVVYSQRRSILEIKKYKIVDWKDILYVEESE